MAEFKDRLEQALTIRDLSPAELSRKTGIGEGAISQYRKGAYKASQRNLEKIATALNVSVSWLMGSEESNFQNTNIFAFDNIFPIETKRFPVLGNIACGEPIFASEGFDAYIEAGADIQADFCLKTKGDSMTGARICDGDIVFIRKQDMVEDGEIAAVLIDDEATLKRVFYDREANIISLFAENPNYKTMRFSGEELNRIRILGKAVAFQSDVK